MDANKITKTPIEEQEPEYIYFCGGIQPIVIPEELESEEEE